jgi:hypothetical protein
MKNYDMYAPMYPVLLSTTDVIFERMPDRHVILDGAAHWRYQTFRCYLFSPSPSDWLGIAPWSKLEGTRNLNIEHTKYQEIPQHAISARFFVVSRPPCGGRDALVTLQKAKILQQPDPYREREALTERSVSSSTRRIRESTQPFRKGPPT